MSEEILIADKVNFSQNDKELLRNVFRKTNELVYIINTKDTAIYNDEEFFTSQQWYFGQDQGEQKMIYRKVIDFGALPNAGVKSVAHNLPVNASWDFIKATIKAFDPIAVQWIVDDPGLEMTIGTAAISIETTIDYSDFTQCQVILEYTKA